MFRLLRENLILKLISLLTSIIIWFYVSAERTPTITRQINAEVQTIGTAPENVIVRLRTRTIPVEVTGPNGVITALADNDIKAVVSLRTARPGMLQLSIGRYEPPPEARSVTFRALRESVDAEVIAKERKQMPIQYSYNNVAPFGRKYNLPRLEPALANAVGAKEDLLKVDRLVVYIDTRGGSVRDDLPIIPVDKDGVIIRGVMVEPEKTRVELELVEAPASRTLLVSVSHTGSVPAPFVISEIRVVPEQVTVIGKPDVLAQMSSVPVTPIAVDNITADVTRDLPLLLPPNVSVQSGRDTVKVTVRVRDVSRVDP